MTSSDDEEPQRPCGANCITKAAWAWKTPGRCIAADPAFEEYKEGSCIEPVVASVTSTRHNDALKENNKGGIAQQMSKNKCSHKNKRLVKPPAPSTIRYQD